MSDDSHCHAADTASWISIYIESGSRKDAERFRALMVELGAPLAYIAASDPAPDRERRRIARDAAIVAAAAVMSGTSVSGRAKELENKLIRYISGDWQRRESELAEPPAEATDLRKNLWRIVKLNDGGLGWRRILQIIENKG